MNILWLKIFQYKLIIMKFILGRSIILNILDQLSIKIEYQ